MTFTYVKSTGLYKCPDDPTAPITTAGVTAVPVSYAENYDLTGNNPNNNTFCPGLMLSSLTAPASTVLLSEVIGAVVVVTDWDEGTSDISVKPIGGWQSPSDNGLGCGGYWGGGCAAYATGSPLGGRVVGGLPQHTTGSNYLADDGHVKFLQPSQVSTGGVGTLGQPQNGNNAAATDTMYLDAAKTQSVALTFSPI